MVCEYTAFVSIIVFKSIYLNVNELAEVRYFLCIMLRSGGETYLGIRLQNIFVETTSALLLVFESHFFRLVASNLSCSFKPTVFYTFDDLSFGWCCQVVALHSFQ